MFDDFGGATPTTVCDQRDALAWITLGTMSGPIPSDSRHQPANALVGDATTIVVDCGDGAVDQLRKAGIPLPAVHAVVLSHLHVDHTAGLYGLLGRRLQARIPGPLTIHGPPGTLRVVNAIRSSFDFAPGLMADVPGFTSQPEAEVTVVEITDGSEFSFTDVDVTAVANTHYQHPEGSPEAVRYQSLSLRFDTPTRSIVYTGDTGPCEKVERLAAGADVLVSEITDPEQVTARLSRTLPIPVEALGAIKRRFEREHLTADEVGLMARRADVGSVVITHNPLEPENVARARRAIGSHFSGPVVFANDLDRF